MNENRSCFFRHVTHLFRDEFFGIAFPFNTQNKQVNIFAVA